MTSDSSPYAFDQRFTYLDTQLNASRFLRVDSLTFHDQPKVSRTARIALILEWKRIRGVYLFLIILALSIGGTGTRLWSGDGFWQKTGGRYRREERCGVRTGIGGQWFCRCLEARSNDAAAISFIASNLIAFLLNLPEKTPGSGHGHVSVCWKGVDYRFEEPFIGCGVRYGNTSYVCLWALAQKRSKRRNSPLTRRLRTPVLAPFVGSAPTPIKHFPLLTPPLAAVDFLSCIQHYKLTFQ